MSGRADGASPSPLGRLFERRPLRWSLVELCRRTTHEGWEHLQEAEAAGRGVALVVATGTPWVVAARALAAWAGPLHLALPAGTADRRLARLVCRGDDGAPRPAAEPEEIRRALAAGEKVLFVVRAGRLEEPSALVIPQGVPVLPLAIAAPERGRYRLVIAGPDRRLER